MLFMERVLVEVTLLWLFSTC